LKKANA